MKTVKKTIIITEQQAKALKALSEKTLKSEVSIIRELLETLVK